MPSVGEIRSVPAPPQPSWERQEFPAPQGPYTLALKDPDEWAMGAMGWKVELLVAPSSDVTAGHGFLRYMNRRSGVVADRNMVPWTADGRSIALIPTGRDFPHRPVVYEVDSQKRHEPTVEGWSLTTKCAPIGDRILVPRIGGFEILAGGRPLRSLKWDHPEAEWPFTGWLASGRAWFTVGRRSHGDVTWIWFLDPAGNVVAKERLDPFDVEPFDRETYAEVINRGYSLKRRDFSRSVGTQLLRWTDSLHDPRRNVLLLAMTRPLGEPFRERGSCTQAPGVFCHVEDRWVSIELRED